MTSYWFYADIVEVRLQPLRDRLAVNFERSQLAWRWIEPT
jgi:hypothetical protein